MSIVWLSIPNSEVQQHKLFSLFTHRVSGIYYCGLERVGVKNNKETFVSSTAADQQSFVSITAADLQTLVTKYQDIQAAIHQPHLQRGILLF